MQQLYMSEFYNKYKRLFTEGEALRYNKSAFVDIKSQLKIAPSPYNRQFQSRYKDERDGNRPKKLGRSPALDQFEHYVLPRLKTEPDAMPKIYPVNMNSPTFLPKSPQLPNISFQNKLRVLSDSRRDEPRYPSGLPSQPKYLQNFINNHNKVFEKVPPSEPGLHLNRINHHVLSSPKADPLPISKARYDKEKSFSMKEPPLAKQSYQQVKKTPKKRQPSIYESQLYGLNQNPYAFANSKLTDIKLIERFYPKGIINQYKACLFRRHQKKSQLNQRRERLRILLQKEQQI